jgi:TPR repeat protein
MKTRVFSLIGLAAALGLASVAEAQYLAPRQYMRRLNQTPAQPQPPANSTLPPGPTVTPAPSVPAAAVTNSAKARAEKDAATKRTVEFQRKRAEAGSTSAQYDLGMRHLTGDGVEKNLAEARKWFTAAAKQDHLWSKKKLAELEAEYGPPPATPDPVDPKAATKAATGVGDSAPTGDPPATPPAAEKPAP